MLPVWYFHLQLCLVFLSNKEGRSSRWVGMALRMAEQCALMFGPNQWTVTEAGALLT